MQIIEKILSEMTTREKVYQTMIQRSENFIYSDEDAETKLKEYPFGGFFIGEEIIGSETMKGDDIIFATKRARKHSKIPPIICADTEFGCGYMFPDGRYSKFPWQMTLGATADRDMAYDFGKYTAIPAQEIGINLSLGPVSDINMNNLNPVVNTRAISDDPTLVREMLSSMVKGMQEYGMGATAKHFPGDGVDYRDQHFVLTSNTLSMDEWRRTFGAVYKELIDNGLLCVMLGHISLPAYQKERIDGIAPPATLSHELSVDLLKGELGFKYAVMSDALCMNGFRTTYCDQVKSEVECFKSGCDLMLWPTMEYADAVLAAIESGEIPMSRLDDAVRRILLTKYELGLFGGKEFKTDTMDDIHDFSRRVSEAAVTLVRDRKQLFPLKDAKKVAVIGITRNDEEYESLSAFRDEWEKNGIAVDMYREECYEDISGYDLIVYCTFIHQHKPQGMLQIMPSWQTGALDRNKSAVVTFGSPYLIHQNFPTVNAAIAMYSDTDDCQRAAVRAMLGQIPFAGKLPVKLPEQQ